MTSSLRTTLGLLLLVWILAAVGIFFARSARPTPEKLITYLQAHPLPESTSGRQKVIEQVAQQLNKLDFEQRRTLREDDSLENFFRALTPDERREFLAATVPEGFRQMMTALNNMEPERRQELVDRALADLRRETPRQIERLEEEEVRKIFAEGIESFYEQANADVKMDFAPVLEELQQNIQRLR
jgi:hypothetical protein